jgi:hypothetical protein
MKMTRMPLPGVERGRGHLAGDEIATCLYIASVTGRDVETVAEVRARSRGASDQELQRLRRQLLARLDADPVPARRTTATTTARKTTTTTTARKAVTDPAAARVARHMETRR